MKKLVFIAALTFIIVSCSNDEHANYVFSNVKEGDSLFVEHPYGFNFYKKERIPYRYYGKSDPRAPKDTIDFTNVNMISRDYFYQKKTTFIGFASGVIDSTISNPASQDNSQWIGIKPDKKMIDYYLEDHREWNDGTYPSIYGEDVGDKNLFVMAKDVSLKNNDEKLK
jgi:hypothetical protein